MSPYETPKKPLSTGKRFKKAVRMTDCDADLPNAMARGPPSFNVIVTVTLSKKPNISIKKRRRKKVKVIHSLNNVAISLWSVNKEDDLKPNLSNLNLNPPPIDGRCSCCRRHIRELQPFGKFTDRLRDMLEAHRELIDSYGHSWKSSGIHVNDPKVEDFEESLLVKTWRTFNPYFEEIHFTIPGQSGAELYYIHADTVCIPAPGAILLGGIGVCLVGWLRRRRTL